MQILNNRSSDKNNKKDRKAPIVIDFPGNRCLYYHRYAIIVKLFI